MIEKVTGMSLMPMEAKKIISRSETEPIVVRELVKAARAHGEDLTGPGVLRLITATVVEAALGGGAGRVPRRRETPGTHPRRTVTSATAPGPRRC